MRSKRSLHHNSGRDPDGELDVVDGELLRLAAELGAQANQLATVYPPKEAALDECRSGSASVALPKRSRTTKRLWWASTCAALVLAMGLGSQLRLSTTGTVDDAAPLQGPITQPTRQSSALTDTSSSHAHSPSEGGAMISPVMFVSELSDPEFEAWLDLQRGQGDESIAF